MSEWGNRLVIGCLGPLELSVGRRSVELNGARVRTVLVVLALSAGRPVSSDQLFAAVWGEAPPHNPRRSLQTVMTRLRAVLGRDSITTQPSGYRLRVDPNDVDALRFSRLVAEAAARPDAERGLLDEALLLWRGAPFTDVGSVWLDRFEKPKFVEQYLVAVERRVDLAIVDGRAGEQLVRLKELAAQHPVRESLWARLLVALDQSGRPAEALERYEAIRARLVDTLGVDPGQQLQEVHAQLLRRMAPMPSPDQPVPITTVPRQLPSGIGRPIGRDSALRALDELIGHDAPGPAVVTGMAGVGKTTLAVHWAHRVARRFPDGQLYVNLRGFEPNASPVEPSDALRGFLDAFHTRPEQMPATLDGQAARYRSLLAGKRVLVVLDNARDAEQVRPLLPGTEGSLAVVTSREQLLGLVAAGSRAVVLDPLPSVDARALVAERLGHDRASAEPDAVDEIADLCSGLPLALAIASARASTHPGFPLSFFAAELRSARNRLDALSGEDPVSDVRAVFSWSYRTVSPAAARMFRLLGLFPGPEIGVPAAASLAGIHVRNARRLLDELESAHLVLEGVPGRFSLHDLLRAYAAELVGEEETAQERRDAVHRLLDHYLRTALIAARLLNRYRELPAPDATRLEVVVEYLTDYQQAMSWFDIEHHGLLAAVELATDHGFDVHTGQLAQAVVMFFSRRGHWQNWAAVEQMAVVSARRRGDTVAEAAAQVMLARAVARLERWDEAARLCHASVDLCRGVDDRLGEAEAHRALAHVAGELGQHAESLEHDRLALDLYQKIGHERGELRALNGIGWAHAQLGNYEQALGYCTEALERLLNDVDDPDSLAAVWDSVAHIQLHLDQPTDAVASYQRAVELYVAMGDRYFEGLLLSRLGDAHLAAGEPDLALDAWRRSLVVLDELRHPDADAVRKKLEQGSDRDWRPSWV